MEGCPMNVLYLNSPGFDYLGAQLNEGFHLLAKDGVINYKVTYKTEQHGALVKDLRCCTPDEAVASVNWAHIIIYSFGDMKLLDPRVVALFSDDRIKHKRVFIDVFDNEGWQIDPNNHLIYYKREARYPNSNRFKYDNVRSTVFCVFQWLIDSLNKDLDADWDNRDIDISFVAFDSHPLRKAIMVVLEKCKQETQLKIECHLDDSRQPMDIDDYNDVLDRSKIGISIPGAGIDTYRFWEIPGHGAVLCSVDIVNSLQIRNGFESHRHCIYFDNWLYMVEQCVNVVGDKAQWKRMRQATDRHLKFHTTRARAIEFLRIFGEMSSQENFRRSCAI